MLRIKTGTPKTRPITTSQVASVWTRCLTASFGPYEKPLTKKECGQLAYLLKCVGEEAPDVVVYAIKNWGRFASRAGVEAGTSFPGKPHVGFFVKHHGVAVNMLRRSKAKAIETSSQRVTRPPQSA